MPPKRQHGPGLSHFPYESLYNHFSCSLSARQRLLEFLGKSVSVRGYREFFIDNLLVQIHFIIVMIRWTGLAPWEFEFPFPGSLTPTFLT